MYQSKFILRAVETNLPNFKITSNKDCVDLIRKYYYDDDIEIYESVFLILLNNANVTLGFVKLSQGGITGTIIDIRLLLKYVIESLATGVVVVHNHPSGKTDPSDEDKKITKTIKKSLNLINVSLLDHIILSKNDFYSFRINRLI